MPKNTGLWILGLIILAGLAWIIFGNGKNPFSRQAEPSTTPESNSSSSETIATAESSNIIPTAHIVNQIRKNSDGTALSLVGVNSVTGVVVSSKDLTFEEAVKMVGTAAQVCGMARYKTCELIRQA